MEWKGTLPYAQELTSTACSDKIHISQPVSLIFMQRSTPSLTLKRVTFLLNDKYLTTDD